MNRSFLLTLTLAALVCIGAARMTTPSKHARHAARPALAAPGTPDDPEARERFDWMRLRDPATGAIPTNIRARELAFARAMQERTASAPVGGARATAIGDHAWELRGPNNVGGRTRALALDITDENIILAGGITGGMWRSTDAGVSWTRTTRPDQLPSVTCVVQDPRPGHTNVWYCGTGEYRTNVERFGNALYYGNGIFKSTDGGLSWYHLIATDGATNDEAPGPFNYVWNIVVDSSNGAQSEVYAAVYGGIMRSVDGGDSWIRVVGSAGSPSGFTSVAISPTGVLYAGLSSDGGQHGIYRSADGLNWANITPSGFPTSIRGVALDIARSDERMVYVLAETPGAGQHVLDFILTPQWYSLWKYIYAFGDGAGAGGQWVDRSANIPYDDARQGYIYNGLTSYALLLKVKANDPNTVFIGGSNLYVSTNGFTTADTKWLGGYYDNFYWAADGGDLHPDQHALVASRDDPNLLYAATDGGVFRMNDYTDPVPQWSPLNTGFVTTQFYTVAMDHAQPNNPTLLGGLQDNGTVGTDTMASTVAWPMLIGGDGGFCAITDSETAMVLSSQFAMITRRARTAQGTIAYDQLSPDDWYQSFGHFLFVNPLALDPANTRTMYVPYGTSIWRNRNITVDTPSDHWVDLTNSVTSNLAVLSAIGVSKTQPAHRVYYGTVDGQIYRLEDADRTNNVPTDITANAFPQQGYVNCIAVDPFDGDRAIAVFSNYNVQSLFATTDAGATWTAISGNLEENANGTGSGPSCRWAAILHRGADTITLVATSIGVFSTTHVNGMQTEWTLEGATTIGNAIVSMIDVRQSDGYVAAATWGNGMYSTTIPVVVKPTAPQLQLPANHATNISRDTTVRWSAAASATSYTVEVARDAAFATMVMTSTAQTGLSLHLTALAPDTKHYWRVRASAGSVVGDWSEVWDFTTGAAAGVSGGDRIVAGFVLAPFAPNPASSSTLVQFDVPYQTRVALDVYDATGRVVKSVAPAVFARGTHEITLETSALAPGTYFCRVTARGVILVRELVVRR